MVFGAAACSSGASHVASEAASSTPITTTLGAVSSTFGSTRPTTVATQSTPTQAAATPTSAVASSTSAPAATATTTTGAAVGPTTVATTTPAAPGEIDLGDADNGRSLTVPVGATVVVRLTTVSWVFATSPEAAVVLTGPPDYAPASGCVPGIACGTSTARFLVRQPGTNQISASRTYCGEAIRCTDQNSMWKVALTAG